MGGYLTRFYEKKFVKVIFFGLDASGKTTILYRLKLGEVVTTIPTIGFNVETIDVDRHQQLTVWDVGLRNKGRPLIRHYIPGAKGIVFVVDSTDRERLPEAIDDLKFVLDVDDNDINMYGIPILILANKQDLNNTMSTDEILEGLKIDALKRINPRNTWHIMEASAINGEGLTEAMTWLANAIAGKIAYDDVTSHVDKAGKLLMSDHSQKAAQGWSYCLCGLDRVKQWMRGS